jgi:hypothetical protein
MSDEAKSNDDLPKSDFAFITVRLKLLSELFPIQANSTRALDSQKLNLCFEHVMRAVTQLRQEHEEVCDAFYKCVEAYFYSILNMQEILKLKFLD